MVKQEKNTKKVVQSAKKKSETKTVKGSKTTKKTSEKTVKKEPQVQVNTKDKKEKRKLSTLEIILLLIILFLLLLLFMFFGYPWLSKQFGWNHGTKVEQKEKKDQKDRFNDKYKLQEDGKENEKDLEVGDTDQDTSSTDGLGSTTVKYIYEQGSSSNGANQGNGGGNQNSGGNTQTPTKPVQPVVPIATFRLSDGEASTVTLSQANRSTNVVFHGSLAAKAPMPSNGINTGYYVQFMVIAPNEYSQDTLAKMKVSTPTAQYGKLVDGYIGGKPYFYMTQEFIKGTKSKLTINWGDGYEVTYALTFLVETN